MRIGLRRRSVAASFSCKYSPRRRKRTLIIKFDKSFPRERRENQGSYHYSSSEEKVVAGRRKGGGFQRNEGVDRESSGSQNERESFYERE